MTSTEIQSQSQFFYPSLVSYNEAYLKMGGQKSVENVYSEKLALGDKKEIVYTAVFHCKDKRFEINVTIGPDNKIEKKLVMVRRSFFGGEGRTWSPEAALNEMRFVRSRMQELRGVAFDVLDFFIEFFGKK